MAAPILHEGATVQCVHQGPTRPASPDRRVTVGGGKVTTTAAMYSVTGCTLAPSAGGPCVSVQWLRAAQRVRAGGVPVLLTDSTASCVPTATGVRVVTSQQRVRAA